MSVHVDIEAQLDNRSIMVSANDIKGGLERIGADAGKGFSSSLSREMSGGLSGIKGLVAEVGRGLRTGIDSELRGMSSSFDAVSSKVAGIGTAGSAAVAGVAAIGAAAAVAGKQLYDLGAQWDEIADGITIRTGKVGEQLKALTDIVGDVGSSTAASLGSIGDIVGKISQSMPDLTQNSNAVRQMASNLAYLDANGQAVNIRELGKAFDAFGVNAADQVQTLDALNNVAQSTGIPINSLIETVKSGAPQFKQFGLDVGSATGLIASFEDAGLDSAVAVTGLRIALKNVGDDARGAGPALADAVTKIKAFHDAGQEGAAQGAAQDIFGTKNFAPFLDAIETGRLSVEGLNKALEQTGMPIADMQAATDDGAQGWQKLTNTIKTEAGPAASAFFSYLNTEVLYLTGHLTEATTQLKDLAAVPITADSALGKMLLPGGPVNGPGAPAPHGLGASLNRTDALYTPNGLLAPQWGTNPVAGSTGGAGAGAAKLPTAPVTPYNSSLPEGFAGLPQTAAMLSAESSYMDANTSLAEKKARANQLEKSNVATADEIQKARNDVISAEHTQQEAEMRLYDARQQMFDKSNKQLNSTASQMGEIGVKLDQDLGISKGLAGIADNLVRFVGSLALAPWEAKMQAITNAPGQAQGGFGLMGILGAQGVFGPQYTAAGQAAASANGASTTGGYYPGASPGGEYGLPAGTNTGGYGSGGKGVFPDWVQQVGAAFGVTPSTYAGHQETDRHEAGYAPNPMHENRGIDWTGTPEAMQRFADYLKNVPGMEQVIWNGGGVGTGDTVEIAGGRSQPGYFAGDLAGHGNHVHTRQSAPIPLPGGATAAVAPQWSADWNAMAQKESGGNWQDNTGNGYYGGLQFDPKSWAAAGGTQYAPSADQASPYDQAMTAEQLLKMQGPGAWPNTFTPGSSGPAAPYGAGAVAAGAMPASSAMSGLPIPLPVTIVGGGGGFGGGSPFGIPGAPGGGVPGAAPGTPAPGQGFGPAPGPVGGGDPNIAAPTPGGSIGWGMPMPTLPAGGGAGQGYGPGAPGPGSIGKGVGPGAAPGTQIGAAVEPAGGTGKGGVGASDSAMALAGMAASALDVMAPGAGQAAQIGMKLANRAIQYGGQVAGIGVQGLMQTFLPTGGSELANNSWATKLIGGLAGAAPALPNMAGKPAAPPAQGQGQQGGQGQQPGGDTHISVTNQRATEDGTGKDIAWNMQNMYQPPAKP